jgi:hypothetical protein
MKTVARTLAAGLLVLLLGASDVQGGFGLAPAGKTTGSSLTATIVVDTTEGGPDEGQASIRVQKSSTSTAVLFDGAPTSYVRLIVWTQCTANGLSLQESTNAKFVGKMDGWVPGPALAALLSQFGAVNNAAITDTDYAACTHVDGRDILSFTAIIQFER